MKILILQIVVLRLFSTTSRLAEIMMFRSSLRPKDNNRYGESKSSQWKVTLKQRTGDHFSSRMNSDRRVELNY
jgi:hypothetical protein